MPQVRAFFAKMKSRRGLTLHGYHFSVFEWGCVSSCLHFLDDLVSVHKGGSEVLLEGVMCWAEGAILQ